MACCIAGLRSHKQIHFWTWSALDDAYAVMFGSLRIWLLMSHFAAGRKASPGERSLRAKGSVKQPACEIVSCLSVE